MKLLAGWAVSAGLVVLASAANAQAARPLGADRSPDRLVSDFNGPYGAPYDSAPYDSRGPYGYAPELLPPREIYAVLRDNGFEPLGPPRQRGYFYEISATDPNGEDGRLIIDGRNGRIVRFAPAYWEEGTDNLGLRDPYGAQAALRRPAIIRGVPRPPAPIPHVARRAVPLPARDHGGGSRKAGRADAACGCGEVGRGHGQAADSHCYVAAGRCRHGHRRRDEATGAADQADRADATSAGV